MAEFAEVMRQRERMCQQYGCCSIEHLSDNCPLHCVDSIGCKLYMYIYPEKTEEKVMKWAAEHSIMTNAQKFKEVFGIEHLGGCSGLPTQYCHKVDSIARCDLCEFDKFWKQEYKDPRERRRND